MEFKEIIGQETVKSHLIEMVQQNRLSHALLFLGKEGSGALPLALAFAQFIVCQPSKTQQIEDLFGGSIQSDNSSTYKSPEELTHLDSFQRANQLMHPDIHYTYPVYTRKSGEKPKSTDFIKEWREFVKNYPYGNAYDWLQFIGAENKQGNITAEECNDIIKQLNLKSFESGYKVLVLWMPEYLGKEGNKLLKLIEEPPVNTLFILVAENEELILPTILSRCQLIKIPLLETKQIAESLEQKSNVDAVKAQQIAAIAEGNYREAIQLLQHNEEDWQQLVKEWLNSTLRGGPIAQVKFTDEISKYGREKQKQFLRYFNHLIEQSIRIKVVGTDVFPIAENEKDFAQRLNKIASVSQLQVLIEELDKACYYIERNANSKILFQALTIKIFHIIQNKVTLT